MNATALAPALPRSTATAAVPSAEPGRTCWARLVTGLDPEQTGGYALEGPWLDLGAHYELPPGALVAVGVKESKQWRRSMRLTLWRVDPAEAGGLVLVKTWSNKMGRVGKAMLNGIRTRLRGAATPGRHYRPRQVTAPAPRVNERAEDCRICSQRVAPRAGLLQRRTSQAGHGYWRVVHRQCPPRRNTYADTCATCGGWVESDEGVLVEADPESQVDNHIVVDRAGRWGRPREGKWRVVHVRRCPDIPADPPRLNRAMPDTEPQPTRWPAWCERCWQRMAPGEGVRDDLGGIRLTYHRGGHCPPHPHNPRHAPTWTIHESADTPQGITYDYPAGIVARVSLPDGPPSGPGWRRGPDGRVSVIGVVVAAAPSTERAERGEPDRDPLGDDAPPARRAVMTTVWRVATIEEAARVLLREQRRAEAARLAGRLRGELAMLPGVRPPDAAAPAVRDMRGVGLAHLPEVPLPPGAAHEHSRLLVDERRGEVWTVVHNSGTDDDWRLSNWGGYVATRHPLNLGRRALIADLHAHHGPSRRAGEAGPSP